MRNRSSTHPLLREKNFEVSDLQQLNFLSDSDLDFLLKRQNRVAKNDRGVKKRKRSYRPDE